MSNERGEAERTMEPQPQDEGFMALALEQAERALELGEVPVGAVVVIDEEVVSRGFNLRERTQDPTSHAELIAVRAAAQRKRSWRLEDAEVYVTLEPCPMCAGAMVHSRVRRVIYGCDDPKGGALRTLYNLGDDARLNHRFEFTAGVLADESSQLLKRFFGEIRAKRRRLKERG